MKTKRILLFKQQNFENPELNAALFERSSSATGG